MYFHNYLDPIGVLNLTTRTYNALIREGIHTINDLLSCNKDDLVNIRNIGAKSIKEISIMIDSLNEYKFDIYSENHLMNKDNQKIFISYDGLKYIDIAIEKLNLSKRAYNCLKSVGINYYSELIFKLEEELISIPHIGRKTLLELERVKKNFQLKKYIEDNEERMFKVDEDICGVFLSVSEKFNIKPKDFFEAFEQEYSNYNFEKNIIPTICITKDKKFMKKLYENKYIKPYVNEYTLSIIRNSIYGCDEGYLYDNFPEFFKFTDILNETLNDLLNNHKVDLLYDDRFVAIYNSFIAGAKDYLKDNEYEVMNFRIQGKTLEEVGKIKNVTRERIRQIEAKAIKKLNNTSIKFKEDIYSDLFNRYIITKEEFKIAFNDDDAYHYIMLRYGSTSEKDNSLKKPLENILHDKDVPKFFKRACEKAIYKGYVMIGNEYIPCTRKSISNYVLKNFAISAISFEEFCNVYFSILKDINKIEDPKLTVMERGYENKLAGSNKVLWKYGKKIRYYNIELYDFTDLLSTLNLNKYENVEYSTLKFFRLYPELMKNYDIRDEYELHNLLKKICTKDKYPSVNFKRMPNIEFGNADRDNQVRELIIALAPISNNDFAKEYENEYGVSANTVLANYMSNFEQYFYNGVYKIDSPTLPDIISKKLIQLLSKDFYFLSDISEIYKKEFPQADRRLLNPFSVKSIGFKVYSNYAVRDVYSSASEYFNILLTKDDIIDLEKIPASIKEIISYTSQLYKLKSDYQIIEFMPNKIIHFRKLKEFGITKEMLKSKRKRIPA